ncbi:MAG TPA: MarR family winged helix-turn-helix transcriptional regulator [Agromyces sp.]
MPNDPDEPEPADRPDEQETPDSPGDPVARIERALAALRRGGRPPWNGERPPGPSHEGHGHHGPHGHHGRARGSGPGPWDLRTGLVARHRMLATLDAGDRAMSVTELAEAIGVDQPRASRLVQAAVGDGLVVREADPEDARRTRVRLTDAGRAAVRAAGAGRRRAIEAALDGFTDEERAQFAELFARFADGFRRSRER